MKLATLVTILVISFTPSFACTTFAVGKSATKDGSVLAAHTNDGGGTTDPRLVKVPARDHERGSKRPIYASPENYPRYVGYDREVPQYYVENCEIASCSSFEPIGYIPEVEHTYSYYEETYAAMNEYQVGMVESTCSGVFVATSVATGGGALLSIDQLAQIAMERSKTARQAILIMGELAEKYGFYGESSSFEGGAESLFVTDPNEVWAFHILADPTGTSAIWVAARIPDDSVAVVANMFSIREVNLNDTSNFLGRLDMWEIAEEQGLYVQGDPKDFTATFSDGEYSHKYYSGRRMWGVFRLLTSADLPAEYENLKTSKPYPFSVPVANTVDLHDFTDVLRDWYAGTEYSTGYDDEVLAGGPWGTPDRYLGGVSGSWERTIALYRTSDSYIVQSRSWLPNEIGGILWFGPHVAHATTYVPLMNIVVTVPDCLSYGWQGVYNLSTSFWAHRVVHNLAQAKYRYIGNDIERLQISLESTSVELVDNISSSYGDFSSADFTDAIAVSITSLLHANAEKARDESMKLLHESFFKYADGYINFWTNKQFYSASSVYPSWWLDEVGYEDGPTVVEEVKPGSITMKENYLLEAQQMAEYLTLKEQGKIEDFRANTKVPLRTCIEVNCGQIFTEDSYQRCISTCMHPSV